METHNNSFLHRIWLSLHDLLLSFSHEQRQRHLKKSQMSAPKGNIDIWGRLGQYIENVPAEVIDRTKIWKRLSPREPSPQKSERLQKPKQAPLGEHHVPKTLNIDAKPYLHPHVSEQLYKNAMNHINASYHLATKGDRYGAKMHIELAESAVHTASRFMDHASYLAFEEKIDKRIERFMGSIAAQGN